MPFKVQVGPPQISIHHGQTVLISDPDGQIHWPSERGLYFLDTRVVSSWTVFANGEAWELPNGAALSSSPALGFPIKPASASASGPLPLPDPPLATQPR